MILDLAAIKPIPMHSGAGKRHVLAGDILIMSGVVLNPRPFAFPIVEEVFVNKQ